MGISMHKNMCMNNILTLLPVLSNAILSNIIISLLNVVEDLNSNA